MNYQNIPRDLVVVKRAFISKLGVLHFFDYQQIEPRLFAYFAAKLGDDKLARQFRDGEDIYQNLADEVGITRQAAKVLFLSQMYGGTRKTIVRQFAGLKPEPIHVTQEEAHAISDRFHAAWPALRMLSNPRPRGRAWPGYKPGYVQKVLETRGYLRSPWGRHLRPEPFGEHKMLNKLIQGSAADLMKVALLAVGRFQRATKCQSHMISLVHDEIQMDGPVSEITLLHSAIPLKMSQPDEVAAKIGEVVPILVDHEMSFTSWADKVPYEEAMLATV